MLKRRVKKDEVAQIFKCCGHYRNQPRENTSEHIRQRVHLLDLSTLECMRLSIGESWVTSEPVHSRLVTRG